MALPFVFNATENSDAYAQSPLLILPDGMAALAQKKATRNRASEVQVVQYGAPRAAETMLRTLWRWNSLNRPTLDTLHLWIYANAQQAPLNADNPRFAELPRTASRWIVGWPKY